MALTWGSNKAFLWMQFAHVCNIFARFGRFHTRSFDRINSVSIVSNPQLDTPYPYFRSPWQIQRAFFIREATGQTLYSRTLGLFKKILSHHFSNLMLHNPVSEVEGRRISPSIIRRGYSSQEENVQYNKRLSIDTHYDDRLFNFLRIES